MIVLRPFKLNSKGQTLVEYILIVSLITVLAIGLVKVFGGYLKDAITKTSCSLVDEEYVKGDKPGEGYCKGDFKKLYVMVDSPKISSCCFMCRQVISEFFNDDALIILYNKKILKTKKRY